MTIRKSKEKDSSFRRPSNGLKAPPAIQEESPSPTPLLEPPRKLSLEAADPTDMMRSPPHIRHNAVTRKLSDVPQPTQEQVMVNPRLPGQRKISLDAALSGAPLISASGKLVHKMSKATLVTSSSTTAESDTEEHEYFNIDDTQAYLRERREQKLREMQSKNLGSPNTSDSEAERETSSSWTRQPAVFGATSGGSSSSGRSREVQSRIRQWERRLSSDSEESVSSPTRRPVATPRARKPDLKPKPEILQQQNLPPRPRLSQIARARGKGGAVGPTKKTEPPLIEEELSQPFKPPRPRGTEIRRAREGTNKPFVANSPSPSPSSTPTITATNDEGQQRIVLSPNKDSAFRPISNRHSPSPGLAMVKEERSEDAGTTPSALGLGNRRPRSPRGKSPSRTPSPAISTATGESLAPPKPGRRDRNESETQETPPSPSSTASSSSPMGSETAATDSGRNPFNQQMAETLIKYVLASQDNGLKNALRECIMGNPEAVKALQVEK